MYNKFIHVLYKVKSQCSTSMHFCFEKFRISTFSPNKTFTTIQSCLTICLSPYSSLNNVMIKKLRCIKIIHQYLCLTANNTNLFHPGIVTICLNYSRYASNVSERAGCGVFAGGVRVWADRDRVLGGQHWGPDRERQCRRHEGHDGCCHLRPEGVHLIHTLLSWASLHHTCDTQSVYITVSVYICTYYCTVSVKWFRWRFNFVQSYSNQSSLLCLLSTEGVIFLT